MQIVSHDLTINTPVPQCWRTYLNKQHHEDEYTIKTVKATVRSLVIVFFSGVPLNPIFKKIKETDPTATLTRGGRPRKVTDRVRRALDRSNLEATTTMFHCSQDGLLRVLSSVEFPPKVGPCAEG